MKHEGKLKINKKYIFILGIVTTAIISTTIGILIGDHLQEKNFRKYAKSIKNIREINDNKFVSPLIVSISAPATDIGIYTDIKEQIVTYLKKEESRGELEDFSFYFKDLNTPFWFGVNEQESFTPASLYKLPIAVAIYKQSEMEGGDLFLKKAVIYTQDIDTINKNIPENNGTRLIVGNGYSVEELVKIMLKESDNGAKNLLISVLDKKYITELFGLLDISMQNNQGYLVSSKSYALFLRLLYNASYLYVTHSEYILSLLTISDFKEGLVAGVPNNVQIAHKFGTYTTTERGESSAVLHDCGIVYHTNHPYIICFMTKGKSIKYLFSIIAEVSKMVYYEQNSDGQFSDN